MLTAFDCFDLHDAFVYIRNFPSSPENGVLIQQLISNLKYLHDENTVPVYCSRLRAPLSSVMNEKIVLGCHDSSYMGGYLCTSAEVLNALEKIISRMYELYQDSNYLMLEIIADRIHEIPLEMTKKAIREQQIIKEARRL